MKLFIESVLVVFFLLETTSSSAQCDTGKIIGIKIRTVDLRSSSPYRIDCNTFLQSFADIIKTFEFKDTATTKLFTEKIKMAKPNEDSIINRINHIDARCIIYTVYQSGKTDSICIGAAWAKDYFFLNGVIMKFPDEIVSTFIDSVYQNAKIKERER